MKNWEKYEDNIRRIGSDFGVTNDGEIGLCGKWLASSAFSLIVIKRE